MVEIEQHDRQPNAQHINGNELNVAEVGRPKEADKKEETEDHYPGNPVVAEMRSVLIIVSIHRKRDRTENGRLSPCQSGHLLGVESIQESFVWNGFLDDFNRLSSCRRVFRKSMFGKDPDIQ